jgi:hypothetical protein
MEGMDTSVQTLKPSIQLQSTTSMAQGLLNIIFLYDLMT